MDNLLYKGFVALDDLKNRDAKNIKLKEDYLLRKGPAEDNAQTSNRKDLLLDYEIIIPKRSEFHAVKMLNDPMSIYNFLSSKNDPFFYFEDFQSKFVKELPKLLWQTEKMEDLGDFVLLFPNPDKRAVKHLDRKDDNCISFNMMQEYYDSIFNTTYNYPYKKKFTTALKQAFDRAFTEVEEFTPLTQAEKQSEMLGKAAKAFTGIFGIIGKLTKTLKSTGNNKETKSNDGNKMTEEQRAAKPGAGKVGDESENNARITVAESVKNRIHVEGVVPEGGIDAEVLKEKVPKYEKDAMQPLPDDHKEVLKLLTHGSLGEAGQAGSKIVNPTEAIKEELSKKEEKKKQTPEEERLEQEKKAKLERSKLRKVWGGGYYTQPLKNDKKDHQSSKYYWERNQLVPYSNDVMTLVRKTVMATLANQGFLMREIFVNDGDQIAVILTFPEVNMKKIAEEMKLSKTVEFGVTDLMSLEPVDIRYRPLRKNVHLTDDQLWGRTYTAGQPEDRVTYINSIRRDIHNLLLNDCNMKSIVRFCGSIWVEKDAEENIIDEVQPTLEEWEDYLGYLKQIAMHMREIRLLKGKISYIEEKYYGNTKMCATGNTDRRKLDKVEVKRLINRLVVRAFTTTLEHFDNLFNIWDVMNITPTNYAYEFEAATNRMKPRKREFYDLIWMDYFYHYPYTREELEDIINKDSMEEVMEKKEEKKGAELPGVESVNAEDSKVTVYNYQFNKIERLKIVHYLINKLIDVEALQNFNKEMEKILTGTLSSILSYGKAIFEDSDNILFPLHNRFQLERRDYHKMFASIRKYKKVYNDLPNQKIYISYQMENIDDKMGKLGVPTDLNADLKSSRYNNNSEMRSSLHKSSNMNVSKSNFGERSSLISKDGFRQNRSIHAEPFANEQSSLFLSGFKKEYKTQYMREQEEAVKELKKQKSIKVALEFIETTDKFGDPYLRFVQDRYYGVEGKGYSKEYRREKDVIDIEQDVEKYALITDFYAISNQKLISTVYGALNSSASLRDALLVNFTKLNVFEVKNFIESSLSFPLVDSFRNTVIFNLRQFPESTVRNYFGEEICLYFDFLNFYRDKMVVICILGCMMMGLQMLFYLNIAGFAAWKTTERIFEIVSSLFCCFVVFWSKDFYLKWLTFEKEFSVRFGQDNVQEAKSVRPKFVGRYGRNIIDDKVNSEEEDPSKRRFRFIITMIFLGLFCAGTAATAFYLLKFKRRASKEKWIHGSRITNANTARSSRLLQDIDIQLTQQGVTIRPGSKLLESFIPASMLNKTENRKIRKLQDPPTPTPPPEEEEDPCVVDPTNPLCDVEDDYDYDLEGEFPTTDLEEDAFGGVNPDQFTDDSPYIPNLPDATGGDVRENLAKYFDLNELVFNIAEFFRILIFQSIFKKIINYLVRWQNIKYQEDVAEQLILNLGLYQLFNNAIMIVIVALQALTASEVIALVDGEKVIMTLTSCIDNQCTQELSFFFMAYCILQILWTIFRRIIVQTILFTSFNYIKSLIRKTKKKIFSSEQTNAEEFADESEETEALNGKPPAKEEEEKPKPPEKTKIVEPGSGQLFSAKLNNFIMTSVGTKSQKTSVKINQIVKTFYSNPAAMYEKVNAEINSQIVNLVDYVDFDGSDVIVQQYLPLYNTYSYCTLFGVIFPLSFFTCWVIAFVESYIDRWAYLHTRKRPVPKSAKSIGLWLDMISTVSNFAIWSNSFYVAFILFSDKSMPVKLSAFLGMSITLTIASFIYYETSAGDYTSKSVGIVEKRSGFIKKHLFTQTKDKQKDKQGKIQTSFKTFGGEDHRRKNVDLLVFAENQNTELKQLAKEKEDEKLAKQVAEENLADWNGETFVRQTSFNREFTMMDDNSPNTDGNYLERGNLHSLLTRYGQPGNFPPEPRDNPINIPTLEAKIEENK